MLRAIALALRARLRGFGRFATFLDRAATPPWLRRGVRSPMRLGFFRFAGLSSLRRNADALAIHRNFAFRTERADWLAKILPVRNKQVVKHDPVAPWQFLSQCHLGVVRRLRLDISQPVGNPMNMRIDRNAGLPKR